MATRENQAGTGERGTRTGSDPGARPRAGSVTNPQTGGVMVASPAPDRRKMIKALTDQGHSMNYAAQFVDEHLEKEKTLGTIYTDPATGYVMRVKEGAAADTETEA